MAHFAMRKFFRDTAFLSFPADVAGSDNYLFDDETV